MLHINITIKLNIVKIYDMNVIFFSNQKLIKFYVLYNLNKVIRM